MGEEKTIAEKIWLDDDISKLVIFFLEHPIGVFTQKKISEYTKIENGMKLNFRLMTLMDFSIINKDFIENGYYLSDKYKEKITKWIQNNER